VSDAPGTRKSRRRSTPHKAQPGRKLGTRGITTGGGTSGTVPARGAALLDRVAEPTGRWRIVISLHPGCLDECVMRHTYDDAESEMMVYALRGAGVSQAFRRVA
jgi:hypothetical protein